LNVKTYRKAE